MDISILVPFHADDTDEGKHRRRVLNYTQAKWVQLGFEVVIGTDPIVNHYHSPLVEHPHCHVITSATHSHKFSVSRALNDAASKAHGDAYLLFGSDHIPDWYAAGWAIAQLKRHAWSPIYGRIAYASEQATKLILAGHAVNSSEWRAESAPCPGVLAVRAGAWRFVGGMDETYEGWGYEDSDLFARLAKEFPEPSARRSDETLYELWNGVPHRQMHGTPNEALYRAKWGHAHGL